ncbi:hypothetical protein BDFG_04539 [Blastomyces dermatitidis ATCC 26199]|nr:hypothetical protein BDFG_04539 [Blastomyces dermatitidis ATCC 26199]
MHRVLLSVFLSTRNYRNATQRQVIPLEQLITLSLSLHRIPSHPINHSISPPRLPSLLSSPLLSPPLPSWFISVSLPRPLRSRV